MKKTAVVKLQKDSMKFSAGHFTIFSATHRENLHGHNFMVAASITASYEENGMAFDYRYFKKKLIALCNELDCFFLLPGQSKYLKIEEDGEMIKAHFNNEVIPFLKKDVIILPICNITVEELSQWFISHLIKDKKEICGLGITKIKIKVSTLPGQSASTTWNIEDGK